MVCKLHPNKTTIKKKSYTLEKERKRLWNQVVWLQKPDASFQSNVVQVSQPVCPNSLTCKMGTYRYLSHEDIVKIKEKSIKSLR